VYLLTIEPTVSLWDCVEKFIATAGKLEVGHRRVRHFFLLLARFFLIVCFVFQIQIAACINSMSALASGATYHVLVLEYYAPCKEILWWREGIIIV
jgi:hypothetical protein